MYFGYNIVDVGCTNLTDRYHNRQFHSMDEKPKIVYTIGHSNHAWESFEKLLQSHNIELIVDVRSYPRSRFAPWSNRERMPHVLSKAGIDYCWMGDSLGGMPRGPYASRERENKSADDWHRERALAPDFVSGIEDVCSQLDGKRLAVMCSEGVPTNCHRTSLLTPAFQANGIKVRHIDPKTGEIILGFEM